MTTLEDRYRRVLRLLPAAYRAEREEEMVSAFLDGAGPDDENARPRWPEIAGVAALAVRIRLGGTTPRSAAWGRTVRLTALIGLAFQATMSCVYLAQTLGVHGLLPLPFDETPIGDPASAERLWHVTRDLSSLLWIAGYVALVRGRPRVAKATATLGLTVYVLSGTEAAESFVLVVATLALLAGYHRDAPAHRHSGRLAALPVVAGAAVFLVMMMSTWAMTASSRSPEWPGTWVWVWSWLPPSGLFCLALLVACAVCLAAHLTAPRWRSPSVPLALAILTVPVTLARLSYLNPGSDQATDTMNAVTVAQAVALVLAGTILTVIGTRTLPARRTQRRPAIDVDDQGPA
ncbi:hypothetical protein [Herbidospora sp. NBRC 101105]|uniref:hypothetical protein n=1 Tax=Herbidospora sp. NBRC 101105 TaxID=3032195 RepID=UPI0024A1B1DF|nr:hypothetical protein [Herbidospora sp. NBRC 101105]GLX96203.1 hypothetical protein Hesp01_41530 [Herbidospora sp. NBRC 101105]